MTDTSQWSTSRREQMLEALKAVLGNIPGIRHVDRQDLDPTGMLSDANLPAIIVDEERTRYEWTDRHGTRQMSVRSGLVLDLQAYAARSADRSGYDVSTVRELFVTRVIQELVNESTLTVQLAGENQAQAHADDVALDFEVRYPAVEPPRARALVTITVDTDEEFDDRTTTAWDTLAADLYSYDDDSPPDFSLTE